MLDSILFIFLLICVSAFFSTSEISFAASRKIKLRQMEEEGNINAGRVLKIQEQPGHFFTVVQIGLNAVAILGGVIGDTAFSPLINALIGHFIPIQMASQISFLISFSIVTSLFILVADLIPKRIAMIAPEAIAIRMVNPMRFCISLFRPLVWFFNGMANCIFRLFKLPTVRPDDITSDDVYAMVEAGALAGVLRKQEHEIIENVFDLESRTVTSAMTARESVIFFDINENEDSIKDKITNHPYSKFLVCNNTIDSVIGYIDSRGLLNRVLSNQSMALKEGDHVFPVLMIPDTLTLSEALENFKNANENFAVIINEYALIVGIITLNDVMTTLMGDLIAPGQEEQIIAQDEYSWLIEGVTPIDDIIKVLDIDHFPHSEYYETIGGFMMYKLKRLPKRSDSIKYAGYKFEVIDTDSNKINQLLVTQLTPLPHPNKSLATESTE